MWVGCGGVLTTNVLSRNHAYREMLVPLDLDPIHLDTHTRANGGPSGKATTPTPRLGALA